MIGIMHGVRLAWPTVPPMVRAPFANLLPDFAVVDASVWGEGKSRSNSRIEGSVCFSIL